MIDLIRQQKAIGTREATGLIGLVLLAIGLGAIWWPSAPVVCGCVLLYVAHGGIKRVTIRPDAPNPESGGAPGP